MIRNARTILRGAGILLAAFLAAAAPAEAQTYRTFRAQQQSILEFARWRVGPFRLRPVFMIRNVGYDDNVYSSGTDVRRVGDTTAAAGVQLNAHLLFRDWLILTIVEHPEYVYFTHEKRERSWDNIFAPTLKMLMFNRFALTGAYESTKARRRASSEFDVRADERRKSWGGDFFYETSRQTAIGVSGSVETIRYEDSGGEDSPISRALNRREKSLTFETYYRVFSDSSFFISGGRTAYEFENPATRWRDSRSTQISSGIRFPAIGRVRGTLSLGYKRLSPVIPGKKPFSGLIGNTEISVRTGALSFRGAFARDSIFSFDAENIYFAENRWGLGLSYYFLSFLRLDYDYSHGAGSYPEPITVDAGGSSVEEIFRKDTYGTHTAGIVVRVVRTIGVGVTFSSWKRDSNYIRARRDRWHVGGYLTFEF